MRTTISILTLATVLLFAVAATAHDKVVVIPLNICASQSKIVFVSSDLHSGNLGGLNGADSKCQGLADAAGLSGTYKAWLSDSTGSPGTRFTKHTGPYINVDGSVVASHWEDLTDYLAHYNVIGLDERGSVTILPHRAWTDTYGDGNFFSSFFSCNNWTVNTGFGVFGSYETLSSKWSYQTTAMCDNYYHLYCLSNEFVEHILYLIIKYWHTRE